MEVKYNCGNCHSEIVTNNPEEDLVLVYKPEHIQEYKELRKEIQERINMRLEP